MQIILASAKIMNDRVKSIPDISLSTPRFQNEAEGFARDMAHYSAETIAEMLGCSQQIADQNRLRYMRFFDDAAKLPAILAYHGQAYKHLKAETLTVDDLNDAQGKLWVTSFLYGLLRPLDAILPYRMEGHLELPSGEGQNMFGFWKSRLTDILIDAVKADDGVLVHLATEEYQHLFDWQRVRKEVRIVQPLFYVRKGNDLKMQAVWAKTCRGAMTRFIIENSIDKPEDICAFSYEGFSYEAKLGEPDYPHFNNSCMREVLIDAHTHTVASGHAYSSLQEMAKAAADMGLEVLGITEHGPSVPGTCPTLYFKNMFTVPRQMYGIRLLMGCEINILDTKGSLDLTDEQIGWLDLAIAGIHAAWYQGGTKDENTEGMIRVIKNPKIHIISHPGDGSAEMDFEQLVLAAKEAHTLLEVNNHSLAPQRKKTVARDNNLEILRLCKKYDVPTILGSDAHISFQIADYERLYPLLVETDFPDELIMNYRPDKFFDYLGIQR